MLNSKKSQLTVVLGLMLSIGSLKAIAADYPVSDADELQAAMDIAQPGDTIVLLQSGSWEDVNVDMSNSGSMEAPIVVRAETVGAVIISGESSIEIQGDFVDVMGLKFENGYPTSDHGAIIFRGDYNNLYDTEFDAYNYEPQDGENTRKWVSLYGNNNNVANNNFYDKDHGGVIVTVWRDDDSPNFHSIHSNHFRNYADGDGANGWETIRIGDSSQSQSDSYSVIENNLFENMDGEVELISIKSGNNVIRGNTILNSKGHITLRHGKYNLVENNVIITDNKTDAGGIRFYDAYHTVINNYVEGVRTGSDTRGAIVVHSGVNEVGGEPPALNAQWTPHNVKVLNNTIIDSRQSFLYDNKYEYVAEDIYFTNNVIHTTGYPAIDGRAELIRPNYNGELYFGTELGIDLEAGITFEDFPLIPDDHGLLLHETKGAQNLIKLTEADVGVRL